MAVATLELLVATGNFAEAGGSRKERSIEPIATRTAGEQSYSRKGPSDRTHGLQYPNSDVIIWLWRGGAARANFLGGRGGDVPDHQRRAVARRHIGPLVPTRENGRID
jgi:hypothetical protein